MLLAGLVTGTAAAPDVVRGAAGDSAIGAITVNAGKGAAIGAATGGLIGDMRRR